MRNLRLGLLLLLVFSRSAPAAETARLPGSQPKSLSFPKEYSATFQAIRVANKPAQTKLATIYANAAAAAVRDLTQLPYSDGAIFVMEWAEPVRDAKGELLVDATGNWRKGAVTRIDVMQRNYVSRVGHRIQREVQWDFASYQPDGTPLSPAPDLLACAACHTKALERDGVFRGRFPPIK